MKFLKSNPRRKDTYDDRFSFTLPLAGQLQLILEIIMMMSQLILFNTDYVQYFFWE